MELTHIEHLGIAVKSIEACLPYYEEVLGLKWDCIDFTRKTITIKHTVQRFKINGKTQFVVKNKTKSQSSFYLKV